MAVRRQAILTRLSTLLPLVATLYAIWQTCVVPWNGFVYASLDHHAFTLPMRIAWAIAIGEGEWGHWTPWVWRGMSLLGKGEAGTLHPAQWLAFRSIPIDVALRLWQVSAMPLAGLGMLWLLRRVYRLEALAAFAGMGLYALSVFYTANFGMTHMALILAHTPWAVGVTERLLARGTARRGLWAMGLGVLYASMFLLGHPQMVWFVSIAVGWTMLDRGLARRWDASWQRGMILAASAILAGLAIGLAQILPTLDELDRTARGAMDNDARNNFSTHPVHLLETLYPDIVDAGRIGDTFILPEGEGAVHMRNPSDYGVYFGVPLLLLCWYGLVRERRDLVSPHRRWRTALVAALLLAMVLLMLGRYGGLNSLVGYVPLIRDFSSPSRHKVIVAFFLALYAARVLHRELRDRRGRREADTVRLATAAAPQDPAQAASPAAAPSAAATATAASSRETPVVMSPGRPVLNNLDLALLAAPVVAWLIGGFVLDRFVDTVTVGGRTFTLGSAWGRDALWVIGWPCTAAILHVLVAATPDRWFKLQLITGRTMVHGVFAAFAILDLGSHGMRTIRDVPYQSVADIRAADAAMRRPQTTRVHLENPDDFRTYGDPWWDGQMQTLGFVGSLIPVEYFNYRSENQLRVAAVSEVLHDRGASLTPTPVANPLPRIRLARELRREENPIAALDALPPEQVADVALTDERLTMFETFAGPPLDPATEHATLAADTFDRLTIDVAVAHRRVLVISDRFAPGWGATVDGAPRPVLALYGRMMHGVVLEPGDRQVVLRYEPGSFSLGLKCAALGTFLLLLLGLQGWRKA